PATGIVSSILPVFCRRKVFGYTALVLSLVSTGFIGFGLWLHHMFATNLPKVGQSFFTAASMMIAIPTGVQIFCWIATLWGGRLRFKTPLLFVLGFFLNFIIGGLSGVMVASVSLDQQVHDTFFVVAHLHYVLIGGAVFPLFAGFYYWFPKFTGRMLSEGLGRWVFALFMIGFNLTFFPMHQLGLKGMPRRVYTYLPEMGWGGLNLLSSIGGLIIAVSVLLFVIDVFRSLRAGELAGDNPWEADTLEWATSSPPPAYNFARLPTVAGRAALWDRREDQPIIKGVRSDLREMLVTNDLDAVGRAGRRDPGGDCARRVVLAEPAGAGRRAFGGARRPAPAGGGGVKENLVIDVSDLPGYAFGHRSVMWWGTLGIMVIEGTMFAVMIGIYFYLRGRVPDWPPNSAPPELRYGIANTLVLVASVIPNVWYQRAAEREDLKKVQIGLLISLAFAVAFIVLRFYEFTTLNCHWTNNAYGSAVWTLMGLHTTHLITDFIDSVVLTALMFTNLVEGKRFSDVSENAFYWYFVVITWLPIFVVIYLVPRWI